jgi:V8-like Glu-specific endopeptidase
VCVLQADGHCLYRSLEDQLEQTAAAADNGSSSEQQQQYNYQQLRELAADYIREHK